MRMHWDWGTIGLGHNGTRVQYDGVRVGLGLNWTGAQWDGETIGRGHSGTERDGMGLQHFFLMRPFHAQHVFV